MPQRITSHSEALLRDILQSISDGFFALDRDFVVTFFNRAAEQLLNRKSEDVVGKNLFDAFPEARNSIFEKRYTQAMKSRRPDAFEVFFDQPPYTNWYEIRVSPFEQGLSVYFQVTTPRKQAEMQLRESESQLRLLFESVQSGILVQDADGYIILANQVACGIFNMQAPEIEGKTSLDPIWKMYDEKGQYIPGEQHPSMITLRTCKPIHNAVYALQAGAHNPPRWLLVNTQPIMEDGDKVVQVLITFNDITELKQAQEASARNEALLNETGRIAKLGGWELDTQTGRLTWTRELYRIHEVDPEYEPTFETELAFFATEAQPVYRDAIRNAVENGDSFKLELPFMTARGHERWVLLIGWAEQANGKTEKINGILQDITAQKEAEQQQFHLEEQLRQVQKMEAVGHLAGGVAHDFNNLMTAIIGNTELIRFSLQQTQSTDETIIQGLDQIEMASQRATDLTRQLLAFSRKQLIKPQIIDPARKLAQMETMLRRLIREDIHLDIRCDQGTEKISADPSQFEQIIINLVVNARDALPHGGRIKVHLEDQCLSEKECAQEAELRPGHYVCISIADNGTGMTPETVQRIFDPFFTTKPAGLGTGLGLATVHGIVKRSRGHIRVQTRVGQGTRFLVYLPVVKGETAEICNQPQPDHPLKGNETILVCEDEDAVRDLAVRVLEHHGYRIIQAGQAREALERAEQHHGPIHLLLTDIIMPGMNGRELAEELQKVYPEIDVLFVSGYTSDVIGEKGFLDDSTNFLEKPYGPRQLLARVREILGSPSQTSE